MYLDANDKEIADQIWWEVVFVFIPFRKCFSVFFYFNYYFSDLIGHFKFKIRIDGFWNVGILEQSLGKTNTFLKSFLAIFSSLKEI